MYLCVEGNKIRLAEIVDYCNGTLGLYGIDKCHEIGIPLSIGSFRNLS